MAVAAPNCNATARRARPCSPLPAPRMAVCIDVSGLPRFLYDPWGQLCKLRALWRRAPIWPHLADGGFGRALGWGFEGCPSHIEFLGALQNVLETLTPPFSMVGAANLRPD